MSKLDNEQNNRSTGQVPTVSPDEIRAQGLRAQDVVFLGWQKTVSEEDYPLYNIINPSHPSYRSTVTEQTLQALHLRIPRTPSPYPNVPPTPWHAVGTELLSPATAREAIDASGLNFTVAKRPLKEVLDLRYPTGATNSWATVRTDTGEVLGIVGDDYEPIQNSDAFAFFDNLVGTDEAMYETAGMLGRGERIWILAKLPRYINVLRKDFVNKYLLLSNSHDGTSQVRVKLTPIRVVCNNTLTAALQGSGEINIAHTRNATEDMKQALSLLGLSNMLFDQLKAIFNRMTLIKITDKQLLDYVRALVPDNGEEKEDVKSEEIRKTFLELYESGQGADLSRGSLWGAFNCVTEYVDHKMEGASDSRLESVWFGRGEKMKLKAFQLAERMM